MSRNIVVPAKAETTNEEYISSIFYHKNASLDVQVSTIINGDETNQTARMIIVNGSAFLDLMSANPEWATNKPVLKYTEEDLFIVIDKIKNGDYQADNGLT